jgi:hypothetical protein
MRYLSAILALLLLTTGQPFAAAAGVLCEVKGKDCPANAAYGVKCCCETGCDCDGSKERTPAPTRTPSYDNPRLDFALVETPTLLPSVSMADDFKPFRIAVELKTTHALPRVAVTCIRLN